MTLYSVISGALVAIEAEPVGTDSARVLGPPFKGALVQLDRWSTTPADAWIAEARRLDQQADRAAHRARAASIEAEALTRQAGVAMERAREVNRNTGGAT